MRDVHRWVSFWCLWIIRSILFPLLSPVEEERLTSCVGWNFAVSGWCFLITVISSGVFMQLIPFSLFIPSLYFLSPRPSSLSGKTFWRQPKHWLKTQRCWCLVQHLVRTGWHRPPSLLPKPSPSSPMWLNWELPASALMTPRHRSPARASRILLFISYSMFVRFRAYLLSFCVLCVGGSDKCCQRCGKGSGWAHWCYQVCIW